MGDKKGRLTEAISCFTCQARARTEWCVLSGDDLALVDGGKVCREFLPGEIIYREGDECRGVHCIESGLVGMRKSDSGGNEVLLRLNYSGDTMGYRSFLGGTQHNNGAEALEPSIICFIEAATVRELLSHNPALGVRFLGHATDDLDATEDKVLQNTTMPVRARFAHLLLVLKDRYGEVDDNGVLNLELPLSRRDMAAMIGIRPESMSRAISAMQKDNVARFSGRRVHIPDMTALIDELDSWARV